jgi:GxxExxY protein
MQQEDQKFRRTDPVSWQIISACIEVHRTLGPGLLESVYEGCLCRELDLRQVSFRRQVTLPVEYKGVQFECAYRADLIVADTVVVELKAIDQLSSIHAAQLLTYLKLSGYNIGLLVNFNVTALRHGLRRFTIPQNPSLTF